MDKELARYLTRLIADDIDSRPLLGTGISSFECELLEQAFVDYNFKDIQKFLEKKLGWDKQNKD